MNYAQISYQSDILRTLKELYLSSDPPFLANTGRGCQKGVDTLADTGATVGAFIGMYIIHKNINTARCAHV